MKPICFGCKNIITGTVKVHTPKNKKNKCYYYCEKCFEVIEKERALNVYKDKKAAVKRQDLKKQRRRSKKMR